MDEGSGEGRGSRAASILIRTKNEAKNIGATLDAVLEQSVTPHEVFVIDSGSRDATIAIALQRRVDILTISPQEWSYPKALNLGARHATGEILVCLSAHCVPTTDHWLRNLLRHFEDATVAGAWGPDILPGRSRPVRRRLERQEPGSYNVHNRAWGMTNSNSALRRSLWLEFPFDERLPATEDKAWAREAMARGYSLMWDPEAAVWHQRDTFMNAFRRNRAVQAGFAIMFPELDPPKGLVRALGTAGFRKLQLQLRDPSLDRFWTDLRNAPARIAGDIGRMLGARRGRRG